SIPSRPSPPLRWRDWRPTSGTAPLSQPSEERAMPGPVLRLRFVVTDGAIRLAEHRRIVMTVGASDPLAEYRGRAGHWFEVDDAVGKPLYGHRMTDLAPTHYEVFGPEGRPMWLPRPQAGTEFELLAPLLPGAASIVVFSSTGGDRTAPAREI